MGTIRVFFSLKDPLDRKSTRLNSSHDQISYAVFCLKKKNKRKSYEWHRRRRERLYAPSRNRLETHRRENASLWPLQDSTAANTRLVCGCRHSTDCVTERSTPRRVALTRASQMRRPQMCCRVTSTSLCRTTCLPLSSSLYQSHCPVCCYSVEPPRLVLHPKAPGPCLTPSHSSFASFWL